MADAAAMYAPKAAEMFTAAKMKTRVCGGTPVVAAPPSRNDVLR